MIDRRLILLMTVLAGGCQDVDARDEAYDDEVLAQAAPTAPTVRQPQYDATGGLVRPADVETWVFLGTGVNLNYVEGTRAPNAPDFLTTTFMEPSAYRHYKETGVFPEGTMTALLGYRAGSGIAPAKSGQFLGDNVLFEMSVKDSKKNPKEVWTYYGFARGGQRGEAHPAQRCQACHVANAQTDLVFTQFYPNLRKPVTPTTR
ncbi:MAG: cytochrome P460 family protein [Polyangiales bacterium]